MGLTGNDIMKPVRRFNQHKLILDENTNAQFLLLLIKKLKYQLLSWTIRINLLSTWLKVVYLVLRLMIRSPHILDTIIHIVRHSVWYVVISVT